MVWNEVFEQVQAVLGTKLFELAGTPLTVATLGVLTLIALATFAVAALLRRASERFLRRRHVEDEGAVTLTGRLIYYAVLVAGLTTALHMSGVNLSAFFAAGAVFAVAIGFAMQNITQNFVSGVILLVERSIRPNDVIDVGGTLIRVKDMGIRVTLGRTLDDEDIVIPNSLIAGATVRNFTLKDKLYRVRVAVGVEYRSDLRLVRETLESAANALSWRVQEKKPVVLLDAFGASSVDYDVSVWSRNPWDARRHRSELREAIWWAF